MVIENSVVLEVGAIVEAKRIGEGSVIEVNAKIGKGAIVGKVRALFAFANVCILSNFDTSIARLAPFVKSSRERWFQISPSFMEMVYGG